MLNFHDRNSFTMPPARKNLPRAHQLVRKILARGRKFVSTASPRRPRGRPVGGGKTRQSIATYKKAIVNAAAQCLGGSWALAHDHTIFYLLCGNRKHTHVWVVTGNIHHGSFYGTGSHVWVMGVCIGRVHMWGA